MKDHDQRFKSLLQTFLPEFFQLFFPDWAARFDFTHAEFLNQEAFLDPPKGERRQLDVVAKLPTTQPDPHAHGDAPKPWLALIHVEIEHPDSIAAFRPRFLEYYETLRLRHHLPVLPVALFLQVGLNGIGHDVHEERFWDLPVLRFEYLYVGLPALLAEEYVAGDNALGLALSALMRLAPERRAVLAAEALQRIRELPNDAARQYLLGEVVLAYGATTAEQRQELDEVLKSDRYREARIMQRTVLDDVRDEGRLEGQREGCRKSVRVVLELRFGKLSRQIEEQLAGFSESELSDLLSRAVTAPSLQDLGLED